MDDVLAGEVPDGVNLRCGTGFHGANSSLRGLRALLNMNDVSVFMCMSPPPLSLCCSLPCCAVYVHAQGFGGDTMMDHNLFFRSLLETSDHGPYNRSVRGALMAALFRDASFALLALDGW